MHVHTSQDSDCYWLLAFWLVTFCGWGLDAHGIYNPPGWS